MVKSTSVILLYRITQIQSHPVWCTCSTTRQLISTVQKVYTTRFNRNVFPKSGPLFRFWITILCSPSLFPIVASEESPQRMPPPTRRVPTVDRVQCHHSHTLMRKAISSSPSRWISPNRRPISSYRMSEMRNVSKRPPTSTLSSGIVPNLCTPFLFHPPLFPKPSKFQDTRPNTPK